jgi:ATP-binding cassette subfamily E protein 1
MASVLFFVFVVVFCLCELICVVIGKTTALKILAGKLKPNLGFYDNNPAWADIVLHFRGSELQNFFTKLAENSITAITKIQDVSL